MRVFLVVGLMAWASVSMAGQIETVTTQDGVPSRWGITSVDTSGKLRFDEGGFNAGATASATAAAGSGGIEVEAVAAACPPRIPVEHHQVAGRPLGEPAAVGQPQGEGPAPGGRPHGFGRGEAQRV